MARYSRVTLKVQLNTYQPTYSISKYNSIRTERFGGGDVVRREAIQRYRLPVDDECCAVQKPA